MYYSPNVSNLYGLILNLAIRWTIQKRIGWYTLLGPMPKLAKISIIGMQHVTSGLQAILFQTLQLDILWDHQVAVSPTVCTPALGMTYKFIVRHFLGLASVQWYSLWPSKRLAGWLAIFVGIRRIRSTVRIAARPRWRISFIHPLGALVHLNE